MKFNFGAVKFLVLSVFIFLYQQSVAQDTIVKMNKSRIVSKVTEINPKTIKYKKYNNLEGPTIIIDRRQVSRIIYANGSIDSITVKKSMLTNGENKIDKRATDYGKNHLTLNVFDLAMGFGSIGYERILPDGKFSIKVPVSIGFRTLADSTGRDSYYPSSSNWQNTGYYYKYKIFSVGVEGYYYTGGQGTLKYFIGPAMEYGQCNYKVFKTYQNSYYGGYFERKRGNYFALMIKNGLNFQATKSLNFSINGGAGFYFTDAFSYDQIDYPAEIIENILAFEFGLMVGYRFGK